ncbi:polymorphic toxin-type HINT domain-containing protein [uncultured Aquimarina sp.]|uniref:polymorphic toxin-type HINT domain-containing protein n=1 Tax=uncultured Aquimarina sp. TaxID=575652 RepID=UPI002608A7FB|nr:polymorphic toxin-type HINT domain-containing protein [uncultured Aquimarina sp.]
MKITMFTSKITSLLSLFLFVFGQLIYANSTSFQSRPLTPDQIDDPVAKTTGYSYKDSELGRTDMVSINPEAFVSLEINQETAPFYEYQYTIDLQVFPVLENGSEETPYTITLQVTNNTTNSGEFVDVSLYRLTGFYGARIVVLQKELKNLTNNTTTNDTPDNVLLSIGFQAERYYNLSDEIPLITNIINVGQDASGNTIQETVDLNWNPISGAIVYELEWTWLDSFSDTNATLLPNEISLTEREFRLNSTRIQTENTYYQIPLIYDQGYLVYRIRAVGRYLENVSKRYYGKWNVGKDATTVLDWQPNFITIEGHENQKNWQFQASFAEEGKKKEVVSYFDGTLRNRQTVTKINSDDNAIVGEIIYDNQGRPGVEVLPVPSSDATIKYYPDFNRNTGGEVYSHLDFDWNNVGSIDEIDVERMQNSSGASKYYSINNGITSDFKDRLPDAKLYPFSQIEYTPDNTGRIRRKGGVGPDHQLDSGHEMKYFYGVPTQEQLNRLFGYRVGDYLHYKRNIVIDPNGQVSVSYMDPQGRTIATALVGSRPDHLIGLPDESADIHKELTSNLITGVFKEYTADEFVINKQILVDADRTSYTFNYGITNSQTFLPENCTDKEYGFVYDFTISLKDDNGTAAFPSITKKVGQEGSTSAIDFTEVTDAILDIGSYNLSKILKIDEQVLQNYVDDYINQLTDPQNPCYIDPADYAPSAGFTDCFVSCDDCVESLGEQNQYVISQLQEFYNNASFIESGTSAGFITVSWNDSNTDINGPLPIEQAEVTLFIQRYYREWELLKEACLEPCNEFLNACELHTAILMADVSPSGQYGSTDTGQTSDILSVFNENNELFYQGTTQNHTWRNPVIPYADEFGKQSEIKVVLDSDGSYIPDVVENANVNNGTDSQGVPYLWVAPQYLNEITDFLNEWQESWANSLVQYHPEYEYLQYSNALCQATKNITIYNPETGASTNQNIDSESYNEYLETIKTYNDAVAAGLFTTGLNIYDKDPYFSTKLPNDFETSQFFNWRKGIIEEAINTEYEDVKNANGTGVSMLEFTYRSIVCNGLTQCTNSFSGLNTISNLPELQRDLVWQSYKNYYISLKHRVQYVFLNLYTKKKGAFNECVGQDGENLLSVVVKNYPSISSQIYDEESSLPDNQLCNASSAQAYKTKQKRFVPIDVGYDAGNDDKDVIDELEDNGDFNAYLETGKCPLALDLELFLNGIVNEDDVAGNKKSLVGNRSYADRFFATSLYEAFGGVLNDGNSITFTGNIETNTLNLQISVNGATASNFCNTPVKLQLPTTNWNAQDTWSAYNPTRNTASGGWEITGFSNLYYDQSLSNLNSGVYGFQVLATVRSGSEIFEAIFTGTTCAAIGECSTENGGAGELLDPTNGGLYDDCNKKFLVKQSLKSVINDLIDQNQITSTDYSLLQLNSYTNGYLPEFFGITNTVQVSWKATQNVYTIASNDQVYMTIDLSQDLSTLDIKDVTGIYIKQRKIDDTRQITDIKLSYFTNSNTETNVVGNISKTNTELLDFTCCTYIDPNGGGDTGDDDYDETLDCGNDANLKLKFAFHFKNLMNALLLRGEFYNNNIVLGTYPEYNSFLQEFFKENTRYICDQIGPVNDISCSQIDFSDVDKIIWNGSRLQSSFSYITIGAQGYFSDIEFRLADDKYDSPLETLKNISSIENVNFDMYPGSDQDAKSSIEYTTTDGTTVREENTRFMFVPSFGDEGERPRDLYYGCDLKGEFFDETLDCGTEATLGTKFAYHFKNFLNALLATGDFYKKDIPLSNYPEFNTFLQDYLTISRQYDCISKSHCDYINFRNTSNITWDGTSIANAQPYVFLSYGSDRVFVFGFQNGNSNLNLNDLKDISTFEAIDVNENEPIAETLRFTFRINSGEQRSTSSTGYVSAYAQISANGVRISVLSFACNITDVLNNTASTNIPLQTTSFGSSENDGNCTTCIPQIVAPVSCSVKYPEFIDFLDLDVSGNSTRITDYSLPDFFTESYFCDVNFAYLVDAYIYYNNTLGITSTNDLNFLSIEEFGATSLNYGYIGINDVIDTFALAGNDGSNSWNTYVNEVYLVDNQICPPAPLLPKIAIAIDADEPDPCQEFNISISETYQKEAYDQYVEALKVQFVLQYTEQAYRNAEENFTMTYADKEYQYTLYYYDQSGNLIQTVPPEGVDRLDGTADQMINTIRVEQPNYTASQGPSGEKIAPAHRLKTEYKYNSLNQLIWQQTPDGGITRFAYDRLGRIIASQNAKQIVENKGAERFTYTNYDALGRIVEAGEISLSKGTYSITENGKLQKINVTGYSDGFAKADRTNLKEVSVTKYDYTTTDGIQYFQTDYEPYNSRNRVAAILYFNKFSETTVLSRYDNACFYNYDVHGNVKELMMIIPDMAVDNDIAKGIKNTLYDYDLISGNVHTVTYQKDQLDQFIHRYIYDADNRITAVETSANGIVWEKDASYLYYAHGPMARMIVGDKEVQGIDYAYTLQGWLKGVNSESLTPEADMGGDGRTGSTVTKDAFGYSLGYYDGDYTPINAASNTSFAHSNNAALQTNKNLYNGNIKQMVTSLMDTDESLLASQVNHYQYDQLNRIKNMQGQSVLNASISPSYNASYSYDRNGNLENLQRSAVNTDENVIPMDDFTYNYNIDNEGNKLSNQLRSVYDDVGLDPNFDTDIDSGQSLNNYIYDEIGQLYKDKAEGLTISWRADGKVKKVTKNDGTVIWFEYDAMGNRIAKKTIIGISTNTTYYSRDARGNVLSTYETQEDTSADIKSLFLKEQHIYGSSRFGLQENSIDLLSDTPTTGDQQLTTNIVGDKRYELSNHLGNVLSVVSDRKFISLIGGVTSFTPDVLTFNDYYPFGSLLPNRHGNSSDYRYGFNGMEADSELKGEGNSYDFGSRMYDPRIGRWFAEDPMGYALPSSSPYSFANNNPIVLIDPDGELPIIPLLIKAGAAGAADMMMQVGMAYYFDDNVESLGQAFDKVDYWQVSRSAAEGLIPWKVPGGKLGKAAATAVGDVLINATKAGVTGGEYSRSQATQDFMVGFLGSLAGDGIMKLVKKYGGNKVLDVFKKFNIQPPCGCFTEGTKVYTEDGHKEIKDVKVGDLVWAYDEYTSKIELQEVIDTFKFERDHVYKIYFGDQIIEATNDHPFFIGGKWLKVEELSVGDELTLYDGTKEVIENIEYEKRNVTVYNFEVDNFHTYYVSGKNVLVHNCPWRKRLAKDGSTFMGLVNKDGSWGARSSQYRGNLARFTGKVLADMKGFDAHHMLPKNKKFSKFFKKNGIDVNDPNYMKWMSQESHKGKFSSEYDKLWNQFIERADGKTFSPQQLMEKAKQFEKQAAKAAADHAEKKAKG